MAHRAATALPVSSEGLTGFGVLGLDSISSSFGHNTFFKEFLMCLVEVYLFSVRQLQVKPLKRNTFLPKCSFLPDVKADGLCMTDIGQVSVVILKTQMCGEKCKHLWVQDPSPMPEMDQ